MKEPQQLCCYASEAVTHAAAVHITSTTAALALELILVFILLALDLKERKKRYESKSFVAVACGHDGLLVQWNNGVSDLG